MPRGDRTGPMGQGPRTGRGAGYCNGAAVPGYANAPGGGGGGMRGGGRGGRGRRNRFYATGLTGWQRDTAGEPPVAPEAAPVDATVQEELAALQAQAQATAAALEQIRQRIDDIAASQSQEAGE